jgi:hypothetical protein
LLGTVVGLLGVHLGGEVQHAFHVVHQVEGGSRQQTMNVDFRLADPEDVHGERNAFVGYPGSLRAVAVATTSFTRADGNSHSFIRVL